MDYFKKIMKESIIVVILTTIIGFITGSFLSSYEGVLIYIPVILIILPALGDTIGDLATVIVSRLTTNLYLGEIEPKIQNSKVLKTDFFNLSITMALCCITILLMGYGIAFFTSVPIVYPFLIIVIVMISGLLLFALLFIVLVVSSIYLFKRGRDPNNYLVPIATTLADLLTPISVILLIQIFI
ncbi:MAG: magnesium transporter [Candidatus Lokiarchaeota archaeon]|nr:magnesium transporter [Candidatus Lokiarchaeota archaeon]